MKHLKFFLSSLYFAPTFSFARKLVENKQDADLPAFLSRIKGFLMAFVGSLAVLFILIGGIQYITSQGNSQKVDTAKKTLTYAIIGLLFIILANVILGIISGDFLGSIFGSDAARL